MTESFFKSDFTREWNILSENTKCYNVSLKCTCISLDFGLNAAKINKIVDDSIATVWKF